MAKKGFKLEGMDKMMRDIGQEIKNLETVSAAGLIQASRHILEEMEKVPPVIPVNTGNLRGSWDTNTYKSPGRYAIHTFGFTANYAVFVHEMVDRNINWNRPGSGARFMYAAIARNYRNGKILEIIRENSKIQ